LEVPLRLQIEGGGRLVDERGGSWVVGWREVELEVLKGGEDAEHRVLVQHAKFHHK